MNKLLAALTLTVVGLLGPGIETTPIVGAGLQDLPPRQSTFGPLKEVNVDQRLITVESDGKPMPIQVTERTTLERNGVRITLNDLSPGQPVTVVYTTQESERVAESVSVATK